MARTDDAAVQDVLGRNYAQVNGEWPSLTRYISTANVIVTRVVACAAEKDFTFTDEELALMEMWLAAYFYTVMDPQYKRKKTERAEGEFLTTSYLDAAKMLDSSGGCLTAVLASRSAGMFWGGSTEAEQLPYEDRN